ncbi:hypothetical protein WICPIJ_008015 [Wickerhamomyces pijperi]|uniref:SCP domain-containing protein n=1 Tax=Wickerhamomyces pijperi TaxID=599730 RepID=A0A9P8PZF4_WICPI|nr:hypothetical protein WICPIJ_008015 [Wickerhamomyces pijperi]
MKYSTILPLLSLASGATVTTTEVDQVKGVVEVLVQEVVEIGNDYTSTFFETSTITRLYGDYTTGGEVPTYTVAIGATAQTAQPEATTAETISSVPTTAPSGTAQTTTLQPTTSATAQAETPTDSFANEILDATNAKRALTGANALTWSDELASYAQAYADKYDCSGTLVHSGGQYGENLAAGYSTTGAVDAWYNEYTSYSPSNPVASHFTQLVWKSTTQLGCGYKTCGSPWVQYTICSYNPAGNYAGEYSDNVSLP